MHPLLKEKTWIRPCKKYVREAKGDCICQIFTSSITDQSGYPNRNGDHVFLPILLTLTNLIEAFETYLSSASILAWLFQATNLVPRAFPLKNGWAPPIF